MADAVAVASSSENSEAAATAAVDEEASDNQEEKDEEDDDEEERVLTLEDIQRTCRPETFGMTTADAVWHSEPSGDLWSASSSDTVRWQCPASSAQQATSGAGDVPRVDGSNLTPAAFQSKYDAPGVPVLLEGLTDTWAPRESWSIEALCGTVGQAPFELDCASGSDSSVEAPLMEFATFAEYLKTTQDLDPLYLFDATFDEGTALGSAYSVPACFAEDAFGLLPLHERPPYRWFLVGGARSGSVLHVDPLATSAWNALLQGHKRWILLSPDTPKEIAMPLQACSTQKGSSSCSSNAGAGGGAGAGAGATVTAAAAAAASGTSRTPPALWFRDVAPGIAAAARAAGHTVLEFVQCPGETVFIPHGWWHAVLNLETTVAVTHNFVGAANAAAAAAEAVVREPRVASLWLPLLWKAYPKLAVGAADDVTKRLLLDTYADCFV